MVIMPGGILRILVSNVFDRKALLPKHIIIANKVAFPSVIHAPDSEGKKFFKKRPLRYISIPSMNFIWTDYPI